MSKGIGYLQQGVKAGDLNSMLMLAKELGYGDSLPRNEDKALELFQKLADRGWHGMLSQKALIYLRVKKWKEAVAILEKAIPCENRGLMSLLSSLYYLRGDARLGYECLSKAAYCEMDIGALYRLGVKIELGEDGRVRDKREAHRLLCLLTAKKLEFQDNHRRLLSSH